MRILIIPIVALLYVNNTIEAQRLVLENKDGFSISAHVAFPAGKSETTKGSFVFPSLFSNFTKAYGLNAEYYKQLRPQLHAGVGYTNVKFSDWQFNSTSEAFDNSEAFIQSLYFKVAWQNLFHERGFQNKARFHGGLAPGVYFLAVETPEQPVSSSKAVRPGLLATGRIEYAIRNTLALSLSGGYQIVSVKSSIYQETILQWLQVSAGVTFRLNKNQNYLRSNYE